MFKNPFSFNGRIRRLEFGISFLIYFAVYMAVLFATSENGKPSMITYIVLLPLFWFILAQSAKRCHDRNNSGWFQIIPFYIFWMLFADGDVGENDYGLNPKGIGNIDEADEIGRHLVS